MRLAAVFLLLASCAGAQQLDTKAITLANGMTLLVHEDHRIPEEALYFFFKVGSRNEGPGTTGISHFFEHMMFNGAKKYGPGEFDIQMEERGGRNNAYTTADDTVYTDWFPSGSLELVMDLESDRIRDLSFEPKIVECERGVVYSERRTSVEDSNEGALAEQLTAAAFIAHPYHWPVIGWASDIESWTMEDLRHHFRMGYAPNNCVVVAVGDAGTEEVIALARKYLEPIPRHNPPPPVRTREPEQHGERRVILRKTAEMPLQMFAFHVPPANSPDYYPLRLLEDALTEGRSSRLYRRLVDQEQLAVTVESGQEYAFDPGLAIFEIEPRTGIDPAKIERVFTEEIERVRSDGIAAAELEKAKNRVLVEMYGKLGAIGGQAELLGNYALFFGDYRKLFSAGNDIGKVTAAQVQDVAQRFFSRDNRTVATLIPSAAAVAEPQSKTPVSDDAKPTIDKVRNAQ
jgi:zinc protease